MAAENFTGRKNKANSYSKMVGQEIEEYRIHTTLGLGLTGRTIAWKTAIRNEDVHSILNSALRSICNRLCGESSQNVCMHYGRVLK